MRAAVTALLLAGCAASAQAPIAQAPGSAPGPARTPPPAAPLFAFSNAATQGGLVRGTARPDIVRLSLDGAPVEIASDRAFVIGFDRDAPAAAILRATLAAGAVASLRLPVAAGSWRIERVDAPYRPPGFDARRPAELQRIAAARAWDTGERGWLQPLRWPLAGPVRGLFGAQRVYRGGVAGSYHGGIDIAAPTGAVVRAPAAGRIVLAASEPFTLEGRLLIIDHGGGLQSTLMHLSRIDVREGREVAAGEPVAAVGATGRATGPHLHWGLTWRGARLDPLLAAEPRSARRDQDPRRRSWQR